MTNDEQVAIGHDGRPAIQLTPTSFIVLGLRAEVGEATPYRLKQMADLSIGHFWSLPRSQLYAEPARLARAGYLHEDQEPEGRRRKRYSITARGREALQRWVQVPSASFTELRDIAFLKLFFGADSGPLAEAQLASLRARLEAYEAVRSMVPPDAPAGPRQALEAGIDHVRTSIQIWERIAREAAEPARTGAA
jgi:PadR family transcriptional regulator AphA